MVRELDYSNELINSNTDIFDVLEDNGELETDLIDTLKSLEDKLYLCSNEIGINKRALCVKFGDNYKVFLNPVYKAKTDIKLVRETDPLDGNQYIIPRAHNVSICYQDKSGKIYCNVFSNEAAVVLHQGLDCLDGLHANDYGLPILPGFDEASDGEREQIISEYLDSLEKLRTDLDTELQNNEETKKEWDYYRYERAKANGEVEVEEIEGRKPNRKERRLMERLARKYGKEKKN